MKICIFLFINFIFIVSCKKEPAIIERPSAYWGEGVAIRNGDSWSGEPYAKININHGNGLQLAIDSLDEFNLRRESMNIRKIPFSPGTYPVSNTPSEINDSLVGASFYFLDVDVILGAYEILESDSSSFVTLLSYDTISKEIRGTFDLTFIAVHKPSADAPDTLRFRNGMFHTRVIK